MKLQDHRDFKKQKEQNKSPKKKKGPGSTVLVED